MDKLRVAVIGCGCISNMHMIPAKNLGICELVAVCDIKPERAEAAAKEYSAKAYTDYLDMFEKEKLDVVHLCLPHYLHTVVAIDAFKYGINVITEKPMSIALDDAKKAIEESKKYSVKYGVIFQCRYKTAQQFIKNNIQNGVLGKVKAARSTLTWYRPDDYYDSSDWKGTWDKEGGGVIIDQAIHSIDLTNWFIDSKPVSVQANISNRHHKNMIVEDTAEGMIEYENGVLYSFWAMNNYVIDEPIEIRLVCENGTANITYDDATIHLNNGETLTCTQDLTNKEKYSGLKTYWGFQHYDQIRDFYESVIENRKPYINCTDAYETQKIVCAIYESAKSGKTIEL